MMVYAESFSVESINQIYNVILDLLIYILL